MSLLPPIMIKNQKYFCYNFQIKGNPRDVRPQKIQNVEILQLKARQYKLLSHSEAIMR